MKYVLFKTGTAAYLIRDDGMRIDYLVIEANNQPSLMKGEWETWAEYKHCNRPGLASALADALMASLNDIVVSE